MQHPGRLFHSRGLDGEFDGGRCRQHLGSAFVLGTAWQQSFASWSACFGCSGLNPRRQNVCELYVRVAYRRKKKTTEKWHCSHDCFDAWEKQYYPWCAPCATRRVFASLAPSERFATPDEVPFDPVGKPGPIASLRAKRPAQYSIYEYVHRGTPVYVGQTKHTLRKRDQQHRQGGKTYFDRQLNMVMSQHAHIRLICKKSLTCPREGKAWMDIMEYLYIRERKTLRGESLTGCNTNRPRHFQRRKRGSSPQHY